MSKTQKTKLPYALASVLTLLTALLTALPPFCGSARAQDQSARSEQSLDLGASTDEPPEGFQLEVGVFGGVHLFARDLELGVPDGPGLVSHPKHGPQFGLRLAANWMPWLSLEGELSGIPTKDKPDDLSAFITAYKLHLLVHLLHGPVRPFVLVGGGALHVVSTKGSPGSATMLGRGLEQTDIDGAFHVGAGVKYDLSELLALRFDTRLLWAPNVREGGLSNNWEFLLGLAFKFGPEAAAPPPPPPAPKDTDGDGILDPEDQCPNEPEDRDGFQDEDGCPDPDNDGDGILDAADQCPNEPELFNGIDDEDGCPETDEDGDGIVGSADKCPTEPEDKDGFEDEDGCPDPDNDGDGVLDADDRCPTELETRNGFQDEDGCPDELPKEVARFTGVIKGIVFKKNSAAIERKSFKLLGEAVKVLQTYPTLRILIEGHTSSEGNPELNRDLSLRRAASVKEYLVSAGIAEGRVEVQGFGPDRPIAPNATRKGREQNRRIEFKLLHQ